MSQFEKAITRLLSRPKDFTWQELQTVMSRFGYVEKKGSGSKRKFVRLNPADCLSLHEPHPYGILKRYAVKDVIMHLKRYGHI